MFYSLENKIRVLQYSITRNVISSIQTLTVGVKESINFHYQHAYPKSLSPPDFIFKQVDGKPSNLPIPSFQAFFKKENFK